MLLDLIAGLGLGFGLDYIIVIRPNTIAGAGLGLGFSLGYMIVIRPNTIGGVGLGLGFWFRF